MYRWNFHYNPSILRYNKWYVVTLNIFMIFMFPTGTGKSGDLIFATRK